MKTKGSTITAIRQSVRESETKKDTHRYARTSCHGCLQHQRVPETAMGGGYSDKSDSHNSYDL